jgi:hypothetical protein
LGDGQRADARAELRAEGGKRLDREILELVGGDIDLFAEPFERRAVVKPGAGEGRGDIRRAGVLVRIEDMAFVAELGGGDGEHPAELAAADDADGGPGLDDHPGVSATDFVWVSR